MKTMEWLGSESAIACVCVFGLLLCTPRDGASQAGADAAPQPATTALPTVDDLLRVNEIGNAVGGGVTISPDGRWIVFQMSQNALDRNERVTDLWLVSTVDHAPPRRLTHNRPSSSYVVFTSPQWAPDSRAVAYFADNGGRARLWVTRLPPLTSEPIDTNLPVVAGGDRDRNGSYPTDLRWSPDGRMIAFVVADPARSAPTDSIWETATRGITVGPLWSKRSSIDSPNRLCTVELHSRRTECLTDSTFNVLSYDWAPDNIRIVISASRDLWYGSYMNADLYVVNRATKQVSALVQEPGMDVNPQWSPDGRWIAFGSQNGVEDWLQRTWPAVVAADGGAPAFLGAELKRESYGSAEGLHWSPDSRSLYFTASYHMSHQLFGVSRATGQLQRLTSDTMQFYQHATFSRGDSVAALTIQSPTAPPGVYVTPLKPFAPRLVFAANPEFAHLSLPSVVPLSWKSSDGKWDIHGVVLRPPGWQPGRRSPLLVFIEGGPGMAAIRFNISSQYPLLVLASKGYLVLVPNTRGRPGYGEAFIHAISTEKSYLEHPLQDVLDGVNELVRAGDADSSRVGIMGFSYGAILTEYAITQTTRFKAASAGDGATDLVEPTLDAGPQGRALYKVMFGFGSPYDSAEHSLMLRQSALYHVEHVRTPIQLECGIMSAAPTDCRRFLDALKHFDVPSTLVVYPRTGHGIVEAALLQDSYRRNIAWFDYWLLGQGPNPVQAADSAALEAAGSFGSLK